MKAHIEWEFAPFYRRWQGCRRLLWWLWPIRWVLVTEGRGFVQSDFYTTANDAAIALARLPRLD
jgi:bacteriorhodopsin